MTIQDDTDSGAPSEPIGRRHDHVPLTRGLSAKLVTLTVVCVLIAEIFIFIPSIANFRLRWLEERLNTAAAVATVLVEEDADTLARSIEDGVLAALDARAVAIRDPGASRLLLVSEIPAEVDEHVAIAATPALAAIADALSTLASGGDKILRVYGPVGASSSEFELLIPDARLRDAMIVYARNVAILSLIIALITATLVYGAIHRLMIRPIRRMTRSMLDFSRAPDDPLRILKPRPRRDEIGVAERELADMQSALQRTLGEQRHLVQLGLAISKINHDMRNMLAAAQLMSDRLSMVDDPTVQSFAPKLVRTLDRAVAYSEGVLSYGRTRETEPVRRQLRLGALVDEINEIASLEAGADIAIVNEVPEAFEINADGDQIFRALSNLARNAVQAMRHDDAPTTAKHLTIAARRLENSTEILVRDTGPGLPRRARQNLFSAFRGAASSGGTGLGLAIAHELVRIHGGTLDLVESGPGSTIFRMVLPDRPLPDMPRPADYKENPSSPS